MRTDRLDWWPLARPLAEARLVYEARVVRTTEPGGVTLTARQFSRLSRR
jgi:hypothetical protein